MTPRGASVGCSSDAKESGGISSISVLLVDANPLLREGVRRAFDRAGDLQVVGEASSMSEAMSALNRLIPDVMVTEIRLPDGDGIALAQQARQSSQNLGVVVLTVHAGDDTLFAALDAGASAFMGKDATADEVVAAARHAAANPRAFIAHDLADAMHRRMHDPGDPNLSPREREVLDLLAEGLFISQMARRLSVCEAAAKTHVAAIYEKLGAGNRAQALMTARRLGLLIEESAQPMPELPQDQ